MNRYRNETRPAARLAAAALGTAFAAFCSLCPVWGHAADKATTSVTYVQGSDLDTLDPAVTRSTPSKIVIAHLFNQLVKWDGPGMSKIVPDLAESWTTSPDGKVWTFALRPNVKFQDGTPLNADAIKFNLDRIRDPKLGSPNRSYYSDIQSVQAISELVVQISTKHPSPTLLEILADGWSAISSPTAIKKYGRGYGHHPVGTGPYKFTRWMPNDRAVIERNPAYFGASPIPDKLIFRPVPEDSARVVELQTGNADVAGNLSPESAAAVKDNPKVELLRTPGSFQVFFEMNVTKPPFNDVRMRRAVNLAIDRQAIVDKLLLGYGKVPTSPFAPGVQGRRTFKPFAYDPQTAKQLIREVYPNGYPGVVVIWTTAGRYTKDREVSEVVQSYLNAVGLKTEFKVWEWASYQKTLYRAQPGTGTGHGTDDANLWLLGTGITSADIRLRRKLKTGDPSNLTGYSNAQVDRLLDLAASEMNQDKRMRYYGDIQRIVWDEDPASIPLFDQEQVFGLRKNLKGLVVFDDGIVNFNRTELNR
ncbi:ABC transporter substrate-binding protein [Pandoraea sp. ISTKB]|uniref:ABC transporter substrate-binding protein n=1 Tax=Pandoraea sp. ISTKB TaxID=1586708 RepID=UPI0008470599|nr:ABC transporter substrate-binding protein [Pandoraea sp. ISTKB]ODP33808.1 ABC transporter substrate-binding protein [Pandoraea sp. ISTKB]